MNRFKSLVLPFLIVLSAVGATAARPETDPRPDTRPLVQVAILLDTSGSMEGLINQARAKLWSVVTELGRLRLNGRTPRLEVALFEYGNSRLSEQSGYIRKVLEMTSDLDRVSEELFNLNTEGGLEYCGQVISRVLTSCEWSGSSAALKMIFIAGNEPFTQGPVDYVSACREAARKGVVVNTIFCGPRLEGIQTEWKAGADIADGDYSFIDHNYVEVYIRSPQDDEILRLNIELNSTYVGFGIEGEKKKQMQTRQDSRAEAAAPQAAVSRAYAKASGMYVNSEWDVVDAVQADPSRLEKASDADLPAEMKGMSPAERRAYAEDLGRKREAIKAKIEKLGREREAFLKKARQESDQGGKSLDEAMVTSVRKQAAKKKFTIE